jgi:hypothetical protein
MESICVEGGSTNKVYILARQVSRLLQGNGLYLNSCHSLMEDPRNLIHVILAVLS